MKNESPEKNPEKSLKHSPGSEAESGTSGKTERGRSGAEPLLNHPGIWRAGELAVQQNQSSRSIRTGFESLDSLLPGQGWPAGGLIEFLLASTGVGELRVLLPALVSLSNSENRWIAWINPPFVPYAPCLEAAGVDISKILLEHPRNHKDDLWAAERACKSAS